MSLYTKIITEQLTKLKRPEVNPNHVEAYMRSHFGTLDHLDRPTFNREVKYAVKLLDLDGQVQAEALAKSFGLRTP